MMHFGTRGDARKPEPLFSLLVGGGFKGSGFTIPIIIWIYYTILTILIMIGNLREQHLL